MQVVYYRLFIRIVILVITVFSIFYFYVFGYKYNKNIWFYKAGSIYDIKSYSKLDDKKILIDGNKYNLVNNRLVIFWVPRNSCWYMKLWDDLKFVCNDNDFNKIITFSKLNLQKVNIKKIIYPLKLYWNNLSLVKYLFNWEWIEFKYYKNGDLTYKDSIWSHYLINLNNANFVWYDDNWLYLLLKWEFYFIRLKFN